MTDSKEYWEGYYRQNPDPAHESPFARFAAGFLNDGDHLYELGCGNGRDSFYFGKLGVHVVAFDQCDSELAYLNEQNDQPNVQFEAGDFTALGIRPKVQHIYSRFTLHSVAEDKERQTLDWAFETLEENGLMLIEIRSIRDELYGKGEEVGKDEFVTTHYRRFVDFAGFVGRVKEAGFSILYKIESSGLAPYGDNDPVVIRVVAQRKA